MGVHYSSGCAVNNYFLYLRKRSNLALSRYIMDTFFIFIRSVGVLFVSGRSVLIILEMVNLRNAWISPTRQFGT